MLEKTKVTIDNRNIAFDVLKILASFAIVTIHVASNKWYELDYHGFAWNVFTVYECLQRWAVPLFVMISGALFLNTKHTVKKLYGKYILRIVTAFAFWACIYAAAYFVKNHDPLEALQLLLGSEYHFWYLFMITGLYMLTPLLKKLTEEEALMKYFLLLSFLFGFVLPQGTSLLSLFFPTAGAFAQATLDKMHLDFLFGYPFYYVLGYYLTQQPYTKKRQITFAAVGGVGLLLSLALTCGLAPRAGENVKLYFDGLTANMAMETVFVFSLCHVINQIRFSDKAKRVIVRLSQYSFGVYLAHVLVLNVFLYAVPFNTLSINPILSVPLISIIVFTASYLISAVLHHIPILKKYVV